jgi:hypothetical protein
MAPVSDAEDFIVTVERDPWVRMPIWLLNRVSGSALRIYGHLANFANLPDGARPSLAELARTAEVSKATAKRGVDELVDAGAVKVEHRVRDDGSPLPSRYHLRVTDPSGGGVKSDPGVMDDPRGGGVKSDPSLGSDLSTENRQIKKRQKNVSEPRSDVEALCIHLADRIAENTGRRPIVTPAWRTSTRLLLDLDHRTTEQAHWLIDWCQDSDFWRANVLSMPKFRERWDQLYLQSRRDASRAPVTNGAGVWSLG